MTAPKVLRELSPLARWALGIFSALLIAGVTGTSKYVGKKFEQVNVNATAIAVIHAQYADIIQRLARIEGKLDGSAK